MVVVAEGMVAPRQMSIRPSTTTVIEAIVVPQRATLRVMSEDDSPSVSSATLVPRPKASNVRAPAIALAVATAFNNAA